MTLQNIWFERAWARWLLKKKRTADLFEQHARVKNRHESQIINAAMTADAAVLRVNLTHTAPFTIELLLTISTREDYRAAEIVESVCKRVESYRTAGWDFKYRTMAAVS